jgi:hypothetical protein
MVQVHEWGKARITHEHDHDIHAQKNTQLKTKSAHVNDR